MPLECFTHPGQPCFYLTTLEKGDIENMAIDAFMRIHGIAVKKIQGRFCQTTPDLFREFASALQFPFYFGYNWHAFSDCLSDMEWNPANHYLIIIFDAHYLLVDSRSERTLFLTMLDTINKEWITPNAYFPRDRKPTAFHVLLHTESNQWSMLLQYLRDSTSSFTLLNLQ